MPLYDVEFIEVRKMRAYFVNAESREEAIRLIKESGSLHPGAENIEIAQVSFVEVVEEH